MTEAVIEEVAFCDCTNEELERGRKCGQPQCPGVGATCPECRRVFDLYDENDANEWYYGHDCEEVNR